jgi:hypothetical protein
MASNKAVTFNDTVYNPAAGDVPRWDSTTSLWVPSGPALGGVFTSNVQSTGIGAETVKFDAIPTSTKNIYSFTGHIICVCDKDNASAYTSGEFCTWSIAETITAAPFGPIGVNSGTATNIVYPSQWSSATATVTPFYINALAGPHNPFTTFKAAIDAKTGSLQFCVLVPSFGTADAVFNMSIVLIMTKTPYT